MLFIDIFDSIGTLIGLASKAGYLDEKGNVLNADKVLTADASWFNNRCMFRNFYTCCISLNQQLVLLKVEEQDLQDLTIAALFFLSLFFSPILTVIPGFATAPVLIVLGLLMMEPITKIDFSDFTEGLPVFLNININTFNIFNYRWFSIWIYILCINKIIYR